MKNDRVSLDAIESWLDGIMQRLKPGERRRLSMKIGQFVRKQNAARIKSNVTPEGAAMEPRKRKRRIKDRNGKTTGRTSKMFIRMHLARSLKTQVHGDEEVEVGYGYNAFINRIARINHDGLRAAYGRKGAYKNKGSTDGPLMYAQYPARPLLGFAPGDREEIMDSILEWLTPDD